MDNSTQQGGHTVTHHTHIYDPQLTHVPHGHPNVSSDDANGQQDQLQPSASSISAHPDGTPVKRRPGRPKGSTRKNLLAGEALPPKIKRPVGRPRKDGLPAGSVGPSRIKRDSTAGQQPGAPVVSYPGGPYPPIPYGFPLSSAALHPSNIFQVDAAHHLGENDWADMARTNPDAFLNTLLIALASPNPISTAGPTVEEAFKSHLVSLAPNQQQTQVIPSLYSILKTFWLPSSPAYFSLTASTSTARTPSEHRFLYWDPQPLVFNGIACPSCSSPLTNKGRISSGPIKIYDIGKPFFIVGCEYVCRSHPCIAATTSEGRKFASTDPAILKSLPAKLKDEFPAKLLHGDGDVGSGQNVWNWRALGVSTYLWNLVIGGLRGGLKKDVILGLIWAVQHGVPDLLADAGAQQASQSQQTRADEDAQDKMDEDVEEEESNTGSKDGSQPTPTLASTNFSDAYGAAWKENTATTGESSQKQASTSSAATAVQSAVAHSSYNPYPTYPFTPYAYMPHQIVNGHVVAAAMPPTSISTNSATNSADASGPSSSSTPTNKRSPRHCSKCGSQECKGKGGRSFCTNPCQDCGKLECKGRNSRRPDKNCTEGWQ